MVTFDFAGALHVANQLDQLAETIERLTGKHNELRDAALPPQVWAGPFGDRFRALRNAHDRKLQPLPGRLREDAQVWLRKWQAAVNIHNHEQYKEAVELQAGYSNEQRQRARRERDGQLQGGGASAQASPFVRKWVHEGYAPRVEYPSAAALPGEYFVPREAPFAQYELVGDEYVLTHTYQPDSSSGAFAPVGGSAWR